jgi:hypothetical protein
VQQSTVLIAVISFPSFMQLGFNLSNRVTDTLESSSYTDLFCSRDEHLYTIGLFD